MGAALGSALSVRQCGAGAATGRAGGYRCAVTAAIASLRERDPNFEMENFLQRVEMTFSTRVKRAIRQQRRRTRCARISTMRCLRRSRRACAQAKAQHRHELLEEPATCARCTS